MNAKEFFDKVEYQNLAGLSHKNLVKFTYSQLLAFAQAFADHCEAERKKAAAETQRQMAAQIHNDGAEICVKCGDRFLPHLFKPLTICDECEFELTSEINNHK